MSAMKSIPEMRLAIVNQMAEALLDLNDPGDWTENEVEEAKDAAQEYANTLLELFEIDLSVIDDQTFVMRGKLADVRNFMDKYFAEPLVTREFE